MKHKIKIIIAKIFMLFVSKIGYKLNIFMPHDLYHILYPHDGECTVCVFNKQGKTSMHCTHPSALGYKNIKGGKCPQCGRKNKSKKKGCGACIGRGHYTYWSGCYSECDIGQFTRRAGK